MKERKICAQTSAPNIFQPHLSLVPTPSSSPPYLHSFPPPFHLLLSPSSFPSSSVFLCRDTSVPQFEEAVPGSCADAHTVFWDAGTAHPVVMAGQYTWRKWGEQRRHYSKERNERKGKEHTDRKTKRREMETDVREWKEWKETKGKKGKEEEGAWAREKSKERWKAMKRTLKGKERTGKKTYSALAPPTCCKLFKLFMKQWKHCRYIKSENLILSLLMFFMMISLENIL